MMSAQHVISQLRVATIRWCTRVSVCNIMARHQQHSSASTSTQSPRSAAGAPHCAARDAAAATAAATADVADASAALRRLALALARAAACFNACERGAQW